jgi:hypothetical protein
MFANAETATHGVCGYALSLNKRHYCVKNVGLFSKLYSTNEFSACLHSIHYLVCLQGAQC